MCRGKIEYNGKPSAPRRGNMMMKSPCAATKLNTIENLKLDTRRYDDEATLCRGKIEYNGKYLTQ
jgi:hypothetical protein